MAKFHRVTTDTRADVVADIIFIHGLGGDKLSTWQLAKSPESYWPAWLTEDMPQLSVSSFGYDASPSSWLGSAMPLGDRATNLLALLEAEQFGARPIIWVCHSLGGLVVKQLLRTAATLGQASWQRFAECTQAVVFLATPHAGARMANYVNLLSRVLRATVAIEDLRANDSHLRELTQWYRNNARRLGVDTKAYFETQDAAGMRVVDESSADPGIKGVIPVAVDADHFSICKPENREAFVYKSVRQYLAQMTAPMTSQAKPDAAPESASQSALSGASNSHSAKPVSRPEPKADMRLIRESVDAPGSPLGSDNPYYVRRPADGRIEEFAAGKSRTLIIRGPHQSGKSSLLLRYLARCHGSGKQLALIDLRTFGAVRDMRFADFSQQFAEVLMAELNIRDVAAPACKRALELTNFLHDHILPRVDTPWVIAIDEADRAIDSAWQEDFYSALRGWDANRSQPLKKQRWGNLGLVLVAATDPRMLIESGYTSPFNITVPLMLSSFSREALDTLNDSYRKMLSAAELDRLYALLNGHPYLTPLAFYRLLWEEMTFESLCANAASDAGPFSDHLRDKLDGVKSAHLSDAMCEIVQHSAVPGNDRKLFYRLEAAGLVREDGGRIVASNELYRRFFQAVL